MRVGAFGEDQHALAGLQQVQHRHERLAVGLPTPDRYGASHVRETTQEKAVKYLDLAEHAHLAAKAQPDRQGVDQAEMVADEHDPALRRDALDAGDAQTHLRQGDDPAQRAYHLVSQPTHTFFPSPTHPHGTSHALTLLSHYY